jgi:hypothetical protein
VKTKKSKINMLNADLSTDILDIMDKPDVAVWNKMVRMQDFGVKRVNIGPLDQNLIREDKNSIVDSANKRDVADVIISGTKVTDKVDLSKSKSDQKRSTKGERKNY